jgi:mannose-1-phosphate guanylyltransferase/mannose-6-phosphate isomerase
MLRATLDRVHGIPGIIDPLVVGSAAHAALVAGELTEAGFSPDRMVLEPAGRNTAPAAAVAALLLTEGGDDPVILLLPSDHVIGDGDAFATVARHGAEVAAAGSLVTFGIVPTYPETGYGYIRKGEPFDGDAARVAEFVEKPDAATAEAYLADGAHLWNSGMFMFRASRYLEELERWKPAVLAACRRAVAAADRTHGILLDDAAFRSSPSISIDYAVMEHTADAVVLPVDFGWSDVGSWSTVWEMGASDARGNVIIGDVHAHDVSNSYLRSGHRLVAAVGLEDMLVIETPDAVLVMPRHRAQDVKTVVEDLRTAGRREADEVPISRQLWGRVEQVTRGDGYRAERLTVLPGAEAILSPDDADTASCLVLHGTACLGDDAHPAGTSFPVTGDVTVRNRGTTPIDLLFVHIDASPPDERSHPC